MEQQLHLEWDAQLKRMAAYRHMAATVSVEGNSVSVEFPRVGHEADLRVFLDDVRSVFGDSVSAQSEPVTKARRSSVYLEIIDETAIRDVNDSNAIVAHLLHS